MDSLILLEKLRALVSAMPPLEGKGAYGQEQFVWLGRASALVSAWDTAQSFSFGLAVNGMTGNFNRAANHGIVLTKIYQAITSIEDALPRASGQAFGPGAAYDFFKALRALVGTAEVSLFVVDPYMDADIFDGYLSALFRAKHVRLLLTKNAENILVAADRFALQNTCKIELRKSSAIHDRVIFVDGAQCWVLGASIKDAATMRPTYLAPLPADITAQKLRIYEEIWNAAKVVESRSEAD